MSEIQICIGYYRFRILLIPEATFYNPAAVQLNDPLIPRMTRTPSCSFLRSDAGSRPQYVELCQQCVNNRIALLIWCDIMRMKWMNQNADLKVLHHFWPTPVTSAIMYLAFPIWEPALAVKYCYRCREMKLQSHPDHKKILWECDNQPHNYYPQAVVGLSKHLWSRVERSSAVQFSHIQC